MTPHPRNRLELSDEPPARRSGRAMALALAGAMATGVLWYGLSIATGLIFHFMPGAPILAATFAFRHVAGDRRGTWTEVTGILGGGLAVVAAGLAAIQAGGGAFDAPGLVAAVIAVGAAAAVIWLRRTGTNESPDSRPRPSA